MILDFLSLIGYAVLANKLIVWIKANPKTINTISASVLIIIALIIAFYTTILIISDVQLTLLAFILIS